MPFANMKFRLVGEVPGIPAMLAASLVNEALTKIYDEQMWSFQLGEAGWLTPGLLFASGSLYQSAGTITTVVGSNQVTGNAAAAAAWLAYSGSPALTQFQLRLPAYSLYNIIAFDGVNKLTLDRPWMEPAGAGQTYMIYQAYFTVPFADFKRFIEIKDTTNAGPVDYWTYSRVDLSFMDPQRTRFDQPGYAIPYQTDARVGSTTLGYMMYELWPHPLSILPYTFSFVRRGPSLVNNSDTIPYPTSEELVLWRAKELAYLWKEAQKGEDLKRGSGADWRFLAEAARKEYSDKLLTAKRLDRDLLDLYYKRFVRDSSIQSSGEPFATITGGLNIGR